MSLFQSVNPKEKEHKGIIGSFSVDNIKWEPEDDRQASLIAKRYPYEDFPNGSYLQVAQSQMAVFTNNMNAGNSLEDDGTGVSQVSVFVGPCKIKLDTGDSRFAPFRNLTHKLTDGASAFHSVVYFINTTYMNELKWGTTDPVLVQDPEELVNVHVRAYGLFGAHIDQVDKAQASVNARKFIMKVVGTREAFTRDELTDFMRAKILEYVPDLLAKEMVNEGVGVLKLPSHLSEFSNIIQDKLSGNFDQFGLTLDNFSFHSINPLESDLEAINQMKVEKQRAKLEAEGIPVHYDDRPDLIPEDVASTLVVYTPAVPETLGELKAVREKGYKVIKRSRMLGEITQGQKCLAVAGTHGKTTTSTLAAHIFTDSSAGCSSAFYLQKIIYHISAQKSLYSRYKIDLLAEKWASPVNKLTIGISPLYNWFIRNIFARLSILILIYHIN